MSDIEGQISITLKQQQASVCEVALSSTRPVRASRIFIGKTAQQVLETIPALFGVCAISQSRAALLSIGQALGVDIDDDYERARDVLVLAENAKEHLLRIQLDWPPLFGRAIDPSRLPWLSRLVNEFNKALFVDGRAFALDSRLQDGQRQAVLLIDELEQYLQQQVFCHPPAQWLALDGLEALLAWANDCQSIAAQSLQTICAQGWTSQGVSECHALTRMDAAALLNHFDGARSASFIAEPTWQGRCRETTALSRQFMQPLIRQLYDEFHASLITRWVARLVELARIPTQMRQLFQLKAKPVLAQADTAGIAQVEAARGRLVHRVELDGDILSQYQILAPTEWNFHPRGLAAQSLSRLNARDEAELETLARLVVNVIDPCVGYELTIH